MNWFAEWFNSPYYHILYKNRDFQEAENFIDTLINHLQQPSDSRILDIPCGKGRHSIYLNQKGFHVHGADLAPESIKHASASSNDTLSFSIHDMRAPIGENQYDLVLNAFTSFGYFNDPKEDQACIDAFTNALQPKGKLVIDFLNIHKATKELVLEEIKTIDGIEFKISKKIEDGFIIKNISFIDKGESYTFQEQVNMLYKEDFKKYFTSAKLNLLEVFGDYKLNPFDLEKSDRLILIAEK